MIIFSSTGTEKILNSLNIRRETYLSVRKQIKNIMDKMLNTGTKNEEKFLTALSNMYIYKLGTMIRNKLNSEEELQIVLFCKLLRTKILPTLSDDDLVLHGSDFARHVFFELTSNKRNRFYQRNEEEIPLSFIKILGKDSFDIGVKRYED